MWLPCLNRNRRCDSYVEINPKRRITRLWCSAHITWLIVYISYCWIYSYIWLHIVCCLIRPSTILTALTLVRYVQCPITYKHGLILEIITKLSIWGLPFDFQFYLVNKPLESLVLFYLFYCNVFAIMMIVLFCGSFWQLLSTALTLFHWMKFNDVEHSSLHFSVIDLLLEWMLSLHDFDNSDNIYSIRFYSTPAQGSDYSCLKSGNSDNSFRINVITLRRWRVFNGI